MASKIVIDTGNYYPAHDGRIPALDSSEFTDSEYCASCVPDAHLVKGFNSIFSKHLENLARPGGRARA